MNFSAGVKASLRGNAYERVTLPLLGRGRNAGRRRSAFAIAAGAFTLNGDLATAETERALAKMMEPVRDGYTVNPREVAALD